MACHLVLRCWLLLFLWGFLQVQGKLRKKLPFRRNDGMTNKGNRMMSPAKPSFLFLLIDDVGWADFSYNNGTARTPNIDKWARRKGSVILQDFHSGGTVCSPTRATVLTGRNHFRDCVDYVYGCSDMSACVPNFEFAPSRTFTVGDAVRAAGPLYEVSESEEEKGDFL
jgi:hypothetical protein